MTRPQWTPSLPAIAGLAAVVLLNGCNDKATDDTPPPAPPTPTPSAWRTIDDSPIVVLDENGIDTAILDAIHQARQTAPDARSRWLVANEQERSSWAIKWAAPTIAGGVEYVWVQPVNWSAFRIEGRLASPPQNELMCGALLDDVVGFATEELADWVRYIPANTINDTTDATGASTREGGFTIDVLEQRFGRAPQPTDGSEH